VRFAGFLSGGFITAIVVNPPEKKLAKLTYVYCTELKPVVSNVFIDFDKRHVTTFFNSVLI
jgi:hypothetical protein